MDNTVIAEQPETNIKVIGIASFNNKDKLADILNSTGINCMDIMAPERANLEKAASFPADAIVLYTEDFITDDNSWDDGDFLEQFYMIRKEVTSIIISETVSSEIYERAIACGVSKVIAAGEQDIGSIRDSIISVTKKMITRSTAVKIRHYDSKVIAFYSQKGGCGKTTCAVNTAVNLVNRGKKVLLIDSNLQFGNIPEMIDIDKGETLYEMACEKELTPTIMKSYIRKSKTGVDIICAPKKPEEAEKVTPRLIDSIVTTLRVEYDYIVFDCSPTMDECILQVVEDADTVYFVTNPEFPILKGALTCIKTLKMIGIPEKKIQVVINKLGETSFTKSDIESSIQCKVAATLNMDIRAVTTAANSGMPLMAIEGKKKTSFTTPKVVKDFNRFTDQIIKEG